MGPGEPFLLGLDYQSDNWRSWDQRLLESELARMSSLGLGALRLPLTWADFQPGPRQLSDRCLRDLEAAMNTAAAYGIGLIPVVFSPGEGGSFPAWVFPGKEEVLRGQTYLLEVLAAYFRSHRALRAWELDVRGARGLGLVEAWRELLVAAVRREDSRHCLALGLREEELLAGDRGLLEGLASQFDVMVLEWSGPITLAPAACALALALTHRRTLVVLGQMPGGGEAQEEALGDLRQAGALGALLAGEGLAQEKAWEGLGRAAARGWAVGREPSEMDLDVEGFYRDPAASWRALCRQWGGR